MSRKDEVVVNLDEPSSGHGARLAQPVDMVARLRLICRIFLVVFLVRTPTALFPSLSPRTTIKSLGRTTFSGTGAPNETCNGENDQIQPVCVLQNNNLDSAARSLTNPHLSCSSRSSSLSLS